MVTSLASLANAGQRPLTSRTDPRPTAEEWKRKCALRPRLGHGLRRHGRRPGGASTCATTTWWPTRWRAVSALYAQFGEEVSDLHARRMRAWLDDRPQDAFGRHRYDPADFGWTYDGLADEFADYTPPLPDRLIRR